MNLRLLRTFALLLFALSVCCHAQSLGEIARQLRAEKKTTHQPKVITNDDIASSEPAPSAKSHGGSKNGIAAKTAVGGAAEDAKQEAGVDPAQKAGSSAKPGKDQVSEHDAQELRTREINQGFMDRIAALRTQINAAQSELAKLQRAQVESTLEFRRTLGVSPTPGLYEQQQRFINDQIDVQRNLVSSLTSQLEDTLEAARHAGVPHASE